MRSFDTRVVGGRECRAWETYYRREWGLYNDAEGWRVHREAQHAEESGTSEELTLALHDSMRTPSPWTRPRCTALLPCGAEAMEVSDRWVQGGCDPLDLRLARDRALLVRPTRPDPTGVEAVLAGDTG